MRILLSPMPMSAAHSEDSRVRAAAQKLEATFLAEMLKSAGYGKSRSEFNGGAGEDQFSSFLLQKHAELIVSGGGIGLSDQIFASLMDKKNES